MTLSLHSKWSMQKVKSLFHQPITSRTQKETKSLSQQSKVDERVTTK